jgi:hypothetical protein
MARVCGDIVDRCVILPVAQGAPRADQSSVSGDTASTCAVAEGSKHFFSHRPIRFAARKSSTSSIGSMPSQLHWSWSGESSARVGVFFDVVCEVSGRVLEMVEGGAEFGMEDRSARSFAFISVPFSRVWVLLFLDGGAAGAGMRNRYNADLGGCSVMKCACEALSVADSLQGHSHIARPPRSLRA